MNVFFKLLILLVKEDLKTNAKSDHSLHHQVASIAFVTSYVHVLLRPQPVFVISVAYMKTEITKRSIVGAAINSRAKRRRYDENEIQY